MVAASVPGASSAPIVGAFQSHGDIELSGNLKGTLVADAVGLPYGSVLNGILRLEGSMIIEVHNQPYLQTGTGDGAPNPNWTATFPLPETMLGRYPASKLDAEGEGLVLLTESGRHRILVDANGIWNIAAARPTPSESANSSRFQPEAGGALLPDWGAGRLSLDAQRMPTASTGALLMGPSLSFSSTGGAARVMSTGVSSMEWRDPQNATWIRRVDQVYAIVTAPEMKVGWPAERSAIAWVTELQGVLQGNLTLSNVESHARINGSVIKPESGLTVIEGAFQLEGEWDQAGTRWRVDGEASSLLVDEVEAWRDPEGLAVGLLGAASGIAVATLLARPLVVILRAAQGDVLKHPRREAILELVRECPGINAPRIRSKLGLGRATATFHLDVLRRARLVKVERMLKSDRYFAATSQYQPEQAVFAHPVRAHVRSALAEGPGTIDELRAKWPNGHLPRSTLLHHVRVMERLQIIERPDDDPSRFQLRRSQVAGRAPPGREVTA